MRKFFFLFQVLVLGLKGQIINQIKVTDSSACSYYGESTESIIHLLPSNSDAEEIIQRIINVIGLKPRFQTKAANVPNAAAVIYNNRRYILYNPGFIDELNRSAGNEWASVSILAHEIGHHLNGHTLDGKGSRPDLELEADEFSGFVLRRLGATLEQAQFAMKIAADVKASHTHPAKDDRLESIARGWQNAGRDEDVSHQDEKRKIEKPVIGDAPKVEKSSALHEKYIALM